MFLGGLKWGSKLENRNAPSGDPPPSKETYSLRVETDGGGSDSWKGGGGVVYAVKRAVCGVCGARCRSGDRSVSI